MVIQSSNVSMSAERTYAAYKAEAVSYTGWGNLVSNLTTGTADTLPSAKDSVQSQSEMTNKAEDTETSEAKAAENAVYWQILNGQGTHSVIRTTSYSETEFVSVNEIGTQSINNLMNLLFYGNISERKASAEDVFRELLEKYRERMEKMLAEMYYDKTGQNYLKGDTGLTLLGIAPTETWNVTMAYKDLSVETESMTFYSSGKVVTQEGKTIEFDTSVTMSRSFMEYAQVSVDYSKMTLIDPLVINLSEEASEVSSQKFLFDIDADGELDNISLLAETCGFLALDKNADGVINDGSELFGTKSGDGFKELSVFDLDGNGWIDENDEIFNRLRIWTKTADGQDKLVGLGIAGIGAIYLGNIDTRFSMNDAETNETNAMLRKTGIYLTEEGKTGLIQHVDFAVNDNEKSA